jgi:hypothetical protein
MVSSVGLVNIHDMAAVWTRTRGSVFRILESVEDILKTLESDALRKLRGDELNELEAQGIGEDLYIILREIARRVLFGGFWKRDLHRMGKMYPSQPDMTNNSFHSDSIPIITSILHNSPVPSFHGPQGQEGDLQSVSLQYQTTHETVLHLTTQTLKIREWRL